MKHVKKQQEPLEFTNWKAQENEDWQPTYDKLAGTVKDAVKTALMVEQGYICCYCEQRLIEHDSHIEHFRPQNDPNVDALDYNNMLCSCQDRLRKGDPRHCGVAKDNWFDEAMLVSPFDPSCESKFSFTGNGEIKPRPGNNRDAIETIHRLKLDINKLNDLRAKAIEPFLENTLSPAEFQNFVRGYLLRDETGKLGEFWTTIQYLFGA
ncbi:MAG: TIGR02646 family protein [Calditrichaeota bacterium]|nr:TIGR02646 family protein [Calditrichota bacterium]MCB0305007.1 TIGR02646 family protein [Calditrichota bacterium]